MTESRALGDSVLLRFVTTESRVNSFVKGLVISGGLECGVVAVVGVRWRW